MEIPYCCQTILTDLSYLHTSFLLEEWNRGKSKGEQKSEYGVNTPYGKKSEIRNPFGAQAFP